MKFTIGLALCLQLCAMHLMAADPIPDEQKLPRCTDSDFVVTVDNQLEIYLDGTQVSGLTNADAWTAADRVRVPAATKVIAIKGVDVGTIGGILASGAFSTTDGSWKCSNTFYEGWAGVSYDDSAWPAATVIADHGASPWGVVSGISNDAKWIWTPRYTYGDDSDKTVYCRKKPGCSVEPSTGPSCIKSCTGRPDGDYQSCHGCGVYATCSNQYMYDNRPCAPGGLVWDDSVKRCEWKSTTCTQFV